MGRKTDKKKQTSTMKSTKKIKEVENNICIKHSYNKIIDRVKIKNQTKT